MTSKERLKLMSLSTLDHLFDWMMQQAKEVREHREWFSSDGEYIQAFMFWMDQSDEVIDAIEHYGGK